MRSLAPLLSLLAGLLALPAVAAPPSLTPSGFGTIKIGMREAAAKQLGLRPAADDGANSFDCRIHAVPRYPGLYVMAERGVVTRVTIGAPSRLRTDRGLGIGSSEEDVRRAYGSALQSQTAAYDEEPAHDLTFWIAGKKRGILYETDQQGRVTFIRAGGKSIQYIEGCL
jgi:hypothetical protein